MALSDPDIDSIHNLKKQIIAIHEIIKPFMPDFIPGDYIITGGIFASLLNNEPIVDCDVFLNKNVKHMVEESSDAKDGKYSSSFTNEKILGVESVTVEGMAVQFIYTDYETPKDIVDSFDFTHCRIYYDPLENVLMISEKMFQLIKGKRLLIDDVSNADQYRVRKYKEKGWNVS